MSAARRRSRSLIGIAQRPVDEEDTPLLGNRSRSRRTLDDITRNTKLVLFNNYVNVLLIFLPFGILAGALHWNPIVVFVLNFLSIIALASMLSFATEELAKKVGQTIGGLLNASFGNATELIVSLVALINGQIKLVQASMIGSILSNLLLVPLPSSTFFPLPFPFRLVLIILMITGPRRLFRYRRLPLP